MSAQSSQWFGVNGRSSAVLKTINGQAALLGPGKFAGMMIPRQSEFTGRAMLSQLGPDGSNPFTSQHSDQALAELFPHATIAASGSSESRRKADKRWEMYTSFRDGPSEEQIAPSEAPVSMDQVSRTLQEVIASNNSSSGYQPIDTDLYGPGDQDSQISGTIIHFHGDNGHLSYDGSKMVKRDVRKFYPRKSRA